jgi:biotin-dependent carboxylase-like uncharacterized protein
MPTIEVLSAGQLTTVQDLGRMGLGRFGVSQSGAMDPWALRIANTCVGNEENAAALEITGPGTSLRVLGASTFLIAGADLGAHVDGNFIAPGTLVVIKDKQILRFTQRRSGYRAVLAFRGGINTTRTFGSRATDIASSLPRPRLSKGEMLEVEPTRSPAPPFQIPEALNCVVTGAKTFTTPQTFRFIPSEKPNTPQISEQAYVISDRSNRTGFRLQPERPTIETNITAALLRSEPIAPGTIQVPPDGNPILLMADRPTIGGYRVAGHLISVDRSVAAGCAPGDRVVFEPTTVQVAQRLAREQEGLLHQLRKGVHSPTLPPIVAPL